MEEKILGVLAEICESEDILEQRNIDLFEEGYLDSLGFAEFLAELEERFQIVIAPSEVERSDINTPGKILSLVMGRV